MNQTKMAFQEVKKEINSLKYESFNLKKEINELKDLMIQICEIIKVKEEDIQTQKSENTSNRGKNTTNKGVFKPLNSQNQVISIGNQGVPTDRQTNQQTDRQTNKQDTFDGAVELLNSLDTFKKELRLKFKRLTEKELLVFSTLYQLTDLTEFTTYKAISFKLKLTESSIRDYIGKLIKKGIPVNKTKENNKNIKLSISPNLKKVASLSTILQLREI